eukprot:8586956-Alexandrium_andersonii.AAC.1
MTLQAPVSRTVDRLLPRPGGRSEGRHGYRVLDPRQRALVPPSPGDSDRDPGLGEWSDRGLRGDVRPGVAA